MTEKYTILDRRYYHIAGITIKMLSDLPITDTTFHPKFRFFEVDRPGNDTITIRHHFSLPPLSSLDVGEEVYRKPPWAIFRKGPSWIYVVMSENKLEEVIKQLWHHFYTRFHMKTKRGRTIPPRLVQKGNIHQLALINRRTVKIYNKTEKPFHRGNLPSLTLFPTDQVILARLLAEREGCYIHASGVVLDGKGLLFVGHSNAGKSTMAMMLKNQATVLCDDRMIIRRWPEEFKIHGTWSHGDISDVSADSAPLKAILFLKQDRENQLIHMDQTQDIIKILLACLIKPLRTADWWEKMLTLMNIMAHEVPCYTLHFNRDRGVIDLLKHL
jgi:hypothetical protein